LASDAKALQFWNARSLVSRLILLAALISIIVLGVTGLVLTNQFQRASLSQFQQGLVELADSLYAGSTVDEQGQVLAPGLTDSRALRVYSGKYWQIAEVTPKGEIRPLVRSRSLWDSDLTAPPQGSAALLREAGRPLFYDGVGPVKEPLRAAAMLARLPGHEAPLVFMAAEDRSPVDRDAQRFAATTAIALVLLGIGLIAAVFVQVRVGLQPLFDLSTEVALVRKGKTDAVVRTYPAELKPLAEELNALVAHNHEVVERQRTHVGNLAHALKTPLSVMLAECQSRPGPLADVVRRQAEAMHGHVEHHLRRARAAARSQTQRERTPIEPVLEELAHTLERIFREKNVDIDWVSPADLCFQGERQDLMEIVGNVMENACKWGRRHIRVEAMAKGGEALSVIIEDDGPGLPVEARADVLKRGARLDEQTPGSGLGLSIVDELARAYGGGVTLADSTMGGLRIEITLPRADT